MARKANETERKETDAVVVLAPTATNLAQVGANRVAAGKRAVFTGTVGLAVARVAFVQGWNGEEKGKAASFDDSIKEGIDGSRATVFRVAALVKALSARLAKDHKATLASAQGAESAEVAVDTVVADLSAAGVSDLTSLKAYLAKEGEGSAPKSAEDQVRAWFLGTERNPEGKIGEFSAETLSAIADAIAAEMDSRNRAAEAAARKAEAA